MITKKESFSTRKTRNYPKQSDGRANSDSQADSLVELAQEGETEQTAMLEAYSLESQYSAAFAAQIQVKHDQIENIEDKLESLIDSQQSRLQQVRSQQPGLLSLPSTRTQWQRQVQKQQNLMQRLRVRLEKVREIKDSTGIHSARIDELATRKLRFQEPELAAQFDGMREASRLHQLRQRKELLEQQKNRTRKGQVQGLSQQINM